MGWEFAALWVDEAEAPWQWVWRRIADDSGAIALAGIMGGNATAVADTTTQIFLESAFFSPAAIAGKARRLGLSTDSSYRFERGADFEQAYALLLAVK